MSKKWLFEPIANRSKWLSYDAKGDMIVMRVTDKLSMPFMFVLDGKINILTNVKPPVNDMIDFESHPLMSLDDVLPIIPKLVNLFQQKLKKK